MPTKYISRINKAGENLLIKDSEAREALEYTDVYLGAGATSAAVMVSANHHNQIIKGSSFSVTANSNYLWVILPSSVAPTVTIGCIAVPMISDGTTIVDEVTYYIYKSKNTYTETFNIHLF